MKVLQVVPALEQGGVEWDAVEVALALQAQGIENGIVSAGGGMVAKLAAAGIPHHTLPLATKNPLKIVQNANRIARLVRENGYDLVHVRSRAPAWSVKLAAARQGFAWLATYHGVYGTKPRWLKIPYNSVMLKGSRTICVSDFVRRHVSATYASDAERLITIHDGADTGRFFPEAVTAGEVSSFRESLDFAADVPLIVQAGRLTSWKGQHILLQAVARMRHAQVGVLFVGSDQGRIDYTNQLKDLAAKLPPEKRVVFLERHDNMPLVYAAGTVAVNASSSQPEAFGRVIPEAQAMGTLVIATAHGGACETIVDGETGFLVPPGDVAALAARLDDVLDMTHEAKAQMRNAAIRSVREKFSIAETCRRTLAVYRDILKERS